MNRKVVFLFSFLCLIICSWSAELCAQDIKAMEQEANSTLRNAQNLLFSGKLEESDAALNKVAELIAAIRAQDPGSNQLKSLEQRLEKQRTDLNRRMPATAAPPSENRPAPDAAAQRKPDTGGPPKALPRNTRQEMMTLNRALQSLETTEKDRLERIQAGDSHHMQQMEPTMKRIRGKLDELPLLFAKVLETAEKEGVADHPDIAEGKTRVDEVTAWAEREMASARSFVGNYEVGRTAAASDAQELKKLFEEHDQRYFTPIGNLRYAYQSDDIHKAFTLLEEYSGVKPKLEKIIAAYEAKYGATREEIEQSTGSMANVYPWQNFKEKTQEMEEVPVQLAAKIKEVIESDLEMLERRHDFYRISSHDDIRKLAGFQKKHAPKQPAVENLEKLLADDLKKYEARIDQRNWPACKGNRTDRNAALKYFQETWGKDPKHKYTVLSTVITGDWSVQKRDITGKPVMYGLPVLLAVQTPEDKSRGLARVFILTARNQEIANAKMEPPFTSDTVGDSYFIKAKNLK
jgi:hypothetical protein